MPSDATHDLGCGVLVRDFGERLDVTSTTVDLDLRARQGDLPGTAVMWRDHPYEVRHREHDGVVLKWQLAPWPDGETMRVIVRLDRDSVAERFAAFEERLRAVRKHRWSLLLAPLLGLAPARLQERWRREWGFHAAAATGITAVLELVAGGAGMVQGLALAFGGGEWFLPPWLRWMVLLGPVMMAEGVLRLQRALVQDQPMGSLAGLPLLLLGGSSSEHRRPDFEVPQPAEWDPEQGTLCLYCSEQRSDWHDGGVLPYRGALFRLQSMTSFGVGWKYSFERVAEEDGAEAPSLRLVKRPAPVATPLDDAEPPRLPSTIIRTTLFLLAPADAQRRWAVHVQTPAVVLTVAGSLCELLGGVANLGGNLRAASLLAVLDLFLIGEALFRLVWAAVTRSPVGSLLGLPFSGLYRSWIAQLERGSQE